MSYLAFPCEREHHFEGQGSEGGSRFDTLGQLVDFCFLFVCDLGALWATFGHPWGSFSYLLPLWGGALEPLGHLLEKALKKVPRMTEVRTQSGDIFDDILSFCGK